STLQLQTASFQKQDKAQLHQSPTRNRLCLNQKLSPRPTRINGYLQLQTKTECCRANPYHQVRKYLTTRNRYAVLGSCATDDAT
ncbi:unnamed protein product, partial [Arabidopsis halleri]